MQNNHNPLIIELEENLLGNDYVIGDLHGCYHELMKLLRFVEFDKEKDRLFCVGDLEHRGPDSIKCLELLKNRSRSGKQWFFATLGNHETFFDKELDESEIAQSKFHLNDFKEEINKLPYIYKVQHLLHNQFYVLHAELSHDVLFGYQVMDHIDKEHRSAKKCMNMLHNNFENIIHDKLNPLTLKLDENERKLLLWSREIFKYYGNKYIMDIGLGNFDFLKNNNIKQSLKIFCGHNVVPFPLKIGQQYYIDTGACFGYVEDRNVKKMFSEWGNRFFGLSMIDVNTGTTYICVSSSEIEKIETESTNNKDSINHLEIKHGDIFTMSESLYENNI